MKKERRRLKKKAYFSPGLYKRIIAIFLISIMFFTTMPWQDISSHAFDEENYRVDSITVTKIYADGGYDVTQTHVTIRGRYLEGVSVGTMTSSGVYKWMPEPTPNSNNNVQEFLVDGDVGNSMDVGNVTIPITRKELPALNGIENRRVKLGEDGIKFYGSNLEKIKEDTEEPDAVYRAYYYRDNDQSGGEIDLNSSHFTGSAVTIPAEEIDGVAGLQTIVFKKENIESVDFENNSGERDVTITLYNTYEKQFRLIDEISVEGLNMNPNRGQYGDTIIFEADSGLDNYDVFFIKNLSDKFSEDNKGRNSSFSPDVNGRQVLTTEVPPFKSGVIEEGEYYVVLTNKIPVGRNPNDEVNKQLVLDEKFVVIDSEQKITISSIQPSTGPDTGSRAEISGVFFGTLNIHDFLPDDDAKTVESVEGSNETTLRVSYSGGTYKEMTVNSAERTIRVIIGDLAKFAKKSDDNYEYTFTEGLDRITVITPSVTDAETNPLKDVVVETVTTLKIDGQSDVVIRDRDVLENGYTYIPSKTTPTVDKVTPPKIQVSKIAEEEYRIDGERLISIEGENFLVNKFTDDNGAEKIRYPIIELGSEIVLNKNTGENERNSNPGLKLLVLNSDGEEVDGSEGNELGDRIIVYIPDGTTITKAGKAYVKVINPVRNAETEGLSYQKNDAVEFVNIDDPPVIDTVAPSIVSVEGNTEIVVSGNNFQEGIEVYLDGIRVLGVTRERNIQANKMLLKFNAPPGREGTTQLQVVNPDGGIAVADFTYVKTINQDPVIDNFAPSEGTHGTLVVVNGDNFIKPDPTTPSEEGMGIYRLIGSRIKLGSNEINTYNKEQGNIVLKDYVAPVHESMKKYKLLYKDNDMVKAADYYQSVVLKDRETGSFYTVDVDGKGTVSISDGASNNYVMTKPSAEEDKFEALKNAKTYTITYVPGDDTSSDRLIIEDKGVEIATLDILTPYATEVKTVDGVTGSFITGHRIKVVNKNQLYFTVPQLEIEGWYDLTVINPDTKSDSKRGTQGFYYSKHPLKKPEISEIIPARGSTDGGYPVNIIGTNFEENSLTKARVIIGGVEVPQEDISLSTDKTKITFIAPEYPGDLATEVGTDKKTVPVVVVNPDGGSASKEDGFTYVIPTSKPTITRLSPDKGNASGGIPIFVEGWGFRYGEPYVDSNGNFQWDEGEVYVDINNDGEWTQLPEGTVEDLSQDDMEILPKVYFGDRQAEIVEYAGSYMYVKLPTGTRGDVDVYVVNNDHGISGTLKFTYESSNPIITSIEPKVGKKQGKDKIEINGSEFYTSEIEVYLEDEDDEGNTLYTAQEMTVIRFGDTKDPKVSNREIPLDEFNGGRIIGSVTKVTLDNLTVDYNGVAKTLTLTAAKGDKTYQRTIKGYDNSVKYIDLSTLTDGTERYDVFELLRVSMDNVNKKLMVERGYMPHHENNEYDSTQLTIYTPSYYAIGVIPVTVINPDGGEGKTEFEYRNPDSAPKITNITKEGRLPVEQDGERILELTNKGGNIVSIIGEDFRSNATIQISDVLTITPDQIEYDSIPNKLTFTMPAVDENALEKKHRVIVINEDGGVASSDEAAPTPIYIKFTKGETYPTIESISPEFGPATGGTKVTIHGKDFRKEIDGKKLMVFFGDIQVPEDDVTVVDYQTIVVNTPSHEPGTVSVKVENPDGEISDPRGEFTYLSTPVITAVVDADDPDEDTRLSHISVEGGETIKLKGSGFMEGARVYFAPIMNPLEEGATPKGQLVYVVGDPHDLEEGAEGTDVVYINNETLTVTTPEGKLDSVGIVVVNPDGGATNIYKDIRYGLPTLSPPTGVVAELVYDRYIKIHWDEVPRAESYEIYVVTDNSREYIGSTELTSFVYEDLEPRTDYRFIVKALGDFGSSDPSMESNEVTTGRKVGPPDDDGELGENTVMEKVGDKAIITIGRDDSKEVNIDLTRGDLAGSKEVIISISASTIASGYSNNVTVNGSDFRVRFNPNIFYNSRIKDNSSETDAGVRFSILPQSQANVSLGETSLSPQYELKAESFVGKDTSYLDYLGSSFQITLDVDTAKAGLRRLTSVNLSRYEGQAQSWMPLSSGDKDSMALTALSDRLGKFTVIGRRR